MTDKDIHRFEDDGGAISTTVNILDTEYVYTPMRICRHCKHWTPPHPLVRLGECAIIDNEDFDRSDKAQTYGGNLSTAGDFGCTLWEAKDA